MHRGYLKIWRKIVDSQSWSRGALHRAVMLTLLVKANWKPSHFAGKRIDAGQVAFSSQRLADELDMSRATLWRVLKGLIEDGFITRRNMNNQFTLVSIVHWQSYQGHFVECEQPARQQADNEQDAAVSLVNNERDTSKERKNERKTSSRRVDSAHAALARQFQQTVADTHGNLAPKLTDSLVNTGAAELEKAVRLDGFAPDEMREALLWAVTDDFWGRNVRSLAGLRKPMKNGMTRLQGVIADFRKRGGHGSAGTSGTSPRPLWAQGLGEVL